MNANANDSTRSPFVVPGHGIPEPQPRRTPQGPTRDAGTNHNPFRWVVPSKPTKAEQEGNLDNESNPTTLVSSPALPGQAHGDAQSHVIPRRTNHNNDALDRTDQPVGQYPEQSHPNPKTKTEGPSIPKIPTIPTSGYVRVLEDHDTLTGYDEDATRTSVNGHSEDEAIPPLMDSFGNINRVLDDETASLSDSTGDRVDDDGVYAVDSTRLREGVQIGTVKRELRDYRPRSKRRAPRQQSRLPFSPQIPKILDFLTRWRIGTTLQLARVAGWRDSNGQRVLKKLRAYDEVGFIRETNLYAGPKIWTATEHGPNEGFTRGLVASRQVRSTP